MVSMDIYSPRKWRSRLIRKYATTNNIDIRIGRSKFEHRQRLKVKYVCKKSGTYGGLKEHGFTTLRTQCPFEILLAFYKHKNNIYEITNVNFDHYHGHPDTATSLNNLASHYKSQGRHAEAEPLYRRDLAISEKVLGAEHPDTAATLNNLANLYESQGRYAEAEPLY